MSSISFLSFPLIMYTKRKTERRREKLNERERERERLNELILSIDYVLKERLRGGER